MKRPIHFLVCRLQLNKVLLSKYLEYLALLSDHTFVAASKHKLIPSIYPLRQIKLTMMMMMMMMMMMNCFCGIWWTDERRLALFLAWTIVRDPHHRESRTRREQDLSLRRT